MKRRRFLTVMGGVLVLSVGLVLANYGGGVTPVGAQGPPANPTTPNPLNQVIDQLNQIMGALTTASGQNNHTLRWDTNNPSATRFVTAFPGAVLDKNTGLVWEQTPEDIYRGWHGLSELIGATQYCLHKVVGGTIGWRLPSVVELNSVRDPSLAAPFVPASRFSGVAPDFYWAATTWADNPDFAWAVRFDALGATQIRKTAVNARAWCVRGPMQESVY